MTAEHSNKKSPLKYWPIAAIALVLIVLAMKVSFIFVPYKYSPEVSDGMVYVIWNNADTAAKFKTFDSVRDSIERNVKIARVSNGLDPDEPILEVNFENLYGLARKSVESATYLYSYKSTGR